jgi:hypothetical protein
VTTKQAEVIVWSDDEDGGHPFSVEVRSPSGYQLGGGTTIPGEHYVGWEDEIAELFEAARQSALGVNKAYQALAEELDLPADDDDIPF